MINTWRRLSPFLFRKGAPTIITIRVYAYIHICVYAKRPVTKGRLEMDKIVFDESEYPNLANYAVQMFPSKRPILNREREIRSIKANLMRPEISNVILLGPAGIGKTSIVAEMSRDDNKNIYLEIDLARMGSDGANKMAARLKGLADEVATYQMIASERGDQSKGLVLFMDEFHQLIQLSAPAVESIKPLLAMSGARNIRIITATTFEEYQQFVQSNEALNQRLQRINIAPPNRDTILSILNSLLERSVPNSFMVDKTIFEHIIDYSERYIPSQSQPRKSIFMLDAMIGWHLAFGDTIDRKLLNKVVYESTGINANFEANVHQITTNLNKRVINQKLAVDSVVNRLNISLADMTDDSKPQGSFLFMGPTGVGKTELAKAMAMNLFGSERSLIRFDMSEYALEESLDLFRNQLTDRVWENPYSIILLDEIEKADRTITRLLLQVLDDARLSSRHGREVVFNNAYIIATTNVGEAAYANAANYNEKEDLSDYMDLLLNALIASDNFPSELVNRFDALVPFNSLKEDAIREIAKIQLQRVVKMAKKKHNVDLFYHKNVIQHLVDEKYDENTRGGGGRGMKRNVENDIITKVARFINEYPEIKKIAIKSEGEKRSEDKFRLESKSVIVVGAYETKKTIGSEKGGGTYA